MASAATDFLIGKIASIIEQESSLIGGVRDDLEEVRRELVSMKSFLKDAEDQKSHTTTAVDETWVADVRDLAYEVEDAIDEFMYHMNQQQGGVSFARFLHQTIYLPKNLWEKHRIATKLQKIIKIVKAIPERRQRYIVDRREGKRSDEDKWVQNHGESTLFMKEEELVGIEDNKIKLMGWLMDEDPRQTVVSLFGMGGSGKTTLAANVYKNEKVKRYFNCHAWITVSQTYVIKELFRRLIKEFHQASKEVVPADLNAKEYRELVEMLHNYLKEKRYLVVLDDVWDPNFWTEINKSLPDTRLGSRIILTTRKEDVASSFGVKSHPFSIEPLPRREAWTLFCIKAFSNYPDKSCPPELESLAWQLLEKCEGLPLAIVALGGLMSSKNAMSDWTKVCNNLNWQLSDNPMLEKFNRVLLLSFNDLSYRLKQCFLYCSLFPEDYEMKRKRLIKLWMAEGFIEHVKGVTPEEVASDYLMALTSRSMLQVVDRNPSGRPKLFRMHDLMRELAVSVSEKEKFCAVYDGTEDMEHFGARRLSIILARDKEIKAWTGMSQLRSFLVFASDMDASSSSNKLPSGFKLLRVLDLEDFLTIEKFSVELIGNLFNLRYLNLKGTPIKELPKSISSLCNLQTLDIRDTDIETLPKGVTKLKNLRHLLMYRYCHDDEAGSNFRYVKGTRAPWKMSKLNKLQVLACIISEGDIIKQVGSMTQLIRIGITNVKEDDEKDLCLSLQKMKLLQYLFLMVTDEEETLQIDAISSPPPLLKTLILVGKLIKVPRWISCLDNVVKLYLHWSRLVEDVLSHIASLPCLGELTLVNAYVGEKLCFCEGFSKLIRLNLMSLPQLEAIAIEQGVMPHLQQLLLVRCINLKTLPKGIEDLSNLQRLDLLEIPVELIERIRMGGVDRHKVQHISSINLHSSPFGIWSYENLADLKTRTSKDTCKERFEGVKPSPKSSSMFPGLTMKKEEQGLSSRRKISPVRQLRDGIMSRRLMILICSADELTGEGRWFAGVDPPTIQVLVNNG
ncbi:hypothetical protein FNV43_RR18425 [Rhamnella rubrinervis]|uniref:Disease resistance protein RPM1 n=1 Tax=Rhamnella rubrinervis TaxID=2594499 RepID=A0A8K0DZ01_9ROSA|nr:hypothetical protein FNV43_RR18425 [Rhamnella rubrinervis]